MLVTRLKEELAAIQKARQSTELADTPRRNGARVAAATASNLRMSNSHSGQLRSPL